MDTSAVDYANGYALLIGIQYNNWVKPLSAPLRDVDALQTHITDPSKAAYKAENTISLIESKATTEGILKALDALKFKTVKDPEATVIIYYSGHGAVDNGKYFLVPYDFNITEYQLSGNIDSNKVIFSQEFAEKISSISAKKCLVILDCCHAENIPVHKGVSEKKDFLNGFVEGIDSYLEDANQKNIVLDKIKKGNGRVILTSCQADETSLDLGSISLFTQVLLECLNGANNVENDGWVRLIDLIRYIPSTVENRAFQYDKHKQRPVFKRIENISSEDFVICAYDLEMKKKSDSYDLLSGANKVKSKIDTKEIYRLIDEGDFSNVFDKIDNITSLDNFQYNRFKREFSAGLKGVDLIDFADRLKVFLSKLN